MMYESNPFNPYVDNPEIVELTRQETVLKAEIGMVRHLRSNLLCSDRAFMKVQDKSPVLRRFHSHMDACIHVAVAALLGATAKELGREFGRSNSTIIQWTKKALYKSVRADHFRGDAGYIKEFVDNEELHFIGLTEPRRHKDFWLRRLNLLCQVQNIKAPVALTSYMEDPR